MADTPKDQVMTTSVQIGDLFRVRPYAWAQPHKAPLEVESVDERGFVGRYVATRPDGSRTYSIPQRFVPTDDPAVWLHGRDRHVLAPWKLTA